MKKKLLLTIVFLLAVMTCSNFATSISLGSLTRVNTVKINPDESVEFVVLVWNVGDSPIYVTLKERSKPENWIVIFKNNNFFLNNTKPEAYPKGDEEYVSTNDGYVKITPIKLVIKSPSNAKPGKYKVIVTLAGREDYTDVGLIQERDFEFNIEIEGENNSIGKVVANTSDQNESVNDIRGKFQENKTSEISGEASKSQNYSIIVIISLLVILFVVIIVRRVK